MNPGAVDILARVIFGMLSLSLVLAFARVVRGPSLPDRVVALDLIAVLSVGFIAVYAVDNQQRVFLDVAIVVALITFLGTVGFTRYIERRSRDE